MFKRVLRNALVICILAVISVGIYLFFNVASDLGTGVEPEDLSLESCPRSSEEAFREYALQIGAFLSEAVSYKDSQVPNYDLLAQKYHGIYVRHSELSYPQCADYLHHLVSEGFRLSALAYSAKAQGGVLGEVKALYYFTEATNKLYLIQFVIYKITPTDPIPPEGFESA